MQWAGGKGNLFPISIGGCRFETGSLTVTGEGFPVTPCREGNTSFARCFCTLVQNIQQKTLKLAGNVKHAYLREFLNPSVEYGVRPFFRRTTEIHAVFGFGHLSVPLLGIVGIRGASFHAHQESRPDKTDGLTEGMTMNKRSRTGRVAHGVLAMLAFMGVVTLNAVVPLCSSIIPFSQNPNHEED